MDESKWGFLCLPLELRQQIYDLYFDNSPSASILHVNRQIHDELIEFVRKFQRTFSVNIRGKEHEFDAFSQWCFKIKAHLPEFIEMKHLILNIFPPDPDKPIDMWHIWYHLQKLCVKLVADQPIPQLTVRFIEDDRAGWATNGALHSTLNLPVDEEDVDGNDIGQILILLCYFLHGIGKTRLILPGSYSVSQHWADNQELLLTGLWGGEDISDEYELLEYNLEVNLDLIKKATGRKSKALFERAYGPVRTFMYLDLEEIKQQWPHMDELYVHERPRFRKTLDEDEWSGNLDVEVSMPDPAWRSCDSDRAEQWHREPYNPSRQGTPTWQTMTGVSDWKAFFDHRQQRS